MTDRDIIRLLIDRDESAIEHIAQAHGDTLRRFAKRLLHSDEAAEECVNDTYWSAWKAIPPANPHNLSAYLLKVCRYTAFDTLDKQHAAKRSAQLVELNEELDGCLVSSTPERDSEAKELECFLQNFLQALPKESRLIFMRRYWFADSTRDIAARYHISESKVKTSLHRTRKKLREALEREGLL